jgi:aerobic carbon-monoxide dehydrogenase large subunit
MPTSGSILGNPVLRKEDPGILEGTTQYYDDLAVSGLLHTAFVRSTVAHANITAIDTGDAKAMPGVVAVYTAADFALPAVHGFVMLPATMNRPPMAQEKVRFVGDIVAMVVAESKGQAMDAAETVIVDYDELPALATVVAALADGAPLIHEAQGSNVANAMGTGPIEGVLDDADVVVRERIVNQRVAPVPMEPAGIVAIPGQPEGGLSIWVSSQGPHGVRDEIAM